MLLLTLDFGSQVLPDNQKILVPVLLKSLFKVFSVIRFPDSVSLFINAVLINNAMLNRHPIYNRCRSWY